MPPKASSASSPCSTANHAVRQAGLAAVPAPFAGRMLHPGTAPAPASFETLSLPNAQALLPVVQVGLGTVSIRRFAGPHRRACSKTFRRRMETAFRSAVGFGSHSVLFGHAVGAMPVARSTAATTRASASVCPSNTGDKLRSGARVHSVRRGHSAAPPAERRLRREGWCRRKLRQLHPLVRRLTMPFAKPLASVPTPFARRMLHLGAAPAPVSFETLSLPNAQALLAVVQVGRGTVSIRPLAAPHRGACPKASRRRMEAAERRSIADWVVLQSAGGGH